MSEDYSLACVACREYVWVAQDGGRRFTFYSGEPETMEVLRRFLATHRHDGHPLRFDMNQRLWNDSADYAEIFAEYGGIYRRTVIDGDDTATKIGTVEDGQDALPKPESE